MDFQRVRSGCKGAQIEVDLDSYGEILQLRGRLLAESDPSDPINQPEFVLPGFGTDGKQYGRVKICARQRYGWTGRIAGLTPCRTHRPIVDEQLLRDPTGPEIIPGANSKVPSDIRYPTHCDQNYGRGGERRLEPRRSANRLLIPPEILITRRTPSQVFVYRMIHRQCLATRSSQCVRSRAMGPVWIGVRTPEELIDLIFRAKRRVVTIPVITCHRSRHFLSDSSEQISAIAQAQYSMQLPSVQLGSWSKEPLHLPPDAAERSINGRN